MGERPGVSYVTQSHMAVRSSMNPLRAVLLFEADSLALWLDEALHDPQVDEEQFFRKVERYGEVLRRMKAMDQPIRYEA